MIQMKTKFKKLGLFMLFLAGILIGCSELQNDGEDLNTEGKGTVMIKLTDAPFPADLVAEANITINRITLLSKFADDQEEEGEEENGELNEESEGETNGGEEDNAAIVIEMETPVTYNLLDLSNGTTALLAEMEIPAGIYPEIRLHVTDAGIVLKDGNTFDLKVPSGNESGLKIKLKPALEMEEGKVVEVLLDFDVSRSFVLRGNMKHGVEKVNGFIFKPVVRGIAQAQLTTGEISGTVKDEAENVIENASLYLISGEDTITSAFTTAEGFFAMIGISPGSYMLACEREGFDAQSIQVEVEKGKLTEQHFILKKTEEENGEGGI
jgi:hypothetical protein